MRVPDSLFNKLSLQSLTARRNDLYAAQKQALTGLRVEKPSDDPVAAARARSFRSQKEQAQSHQRAIGQATTKLNAMDDAMSHVSEAVRRARELAVQGLNDTLTADERASLAIEIEALQAHVLGLANTKVSGRYIFSGMADDQQTFDAAGNYQGYASVQEVEVSPGVRTALGEPGDQIFAAPGQGNLFVALENLKNGLRTNDKAAMQDGLDRVISSESVVIDKWSEIGSQLEALDVAQSVVDQIEFHATESLAREVEIDPLEAFSNLSNAQSALQAAVQMAQELPPPGLVG